MYGYIDNENQSDGNKSIISKILDFGFDPSKQKFIGGTNDNPVVSPQYEDDKDDILKSNAGNAKNRLKGDAEVPPQDPVEEKDENVTQTTVIKPPLQPEEIQSHKEEPNLPPEKISDELLEANATNANKKLEVVEVPPEGQDAPTQPKVDPPSHKEEPEVPPEESHVALLKSNTGNAKNRLKGDPEVPPQDPVEEKDVKMEEEEIQSHKEEPEVPPEESHVALLKSNTGNAKNRLKGDPEVPPQDPVEEKDVKMEEEEIQSHKDEPNLPLEKISDELLEANATNANKKLEGVEVPPEGQDVSTQPKVDPPSHKEEPELSPEESHVALLKSNTGNANNRLKEEVEVPIEGHIEEKEENVMLETANKLKVTEIKVDELAANSMNSKLKGATHEELERIQKIIDDLAVNPSKKSLFSKDKLSVIDNLVKEIIKKNRNESQVKLAKSLSSPIVSENIIKNNFTMTFQADYTLISKKIDDFSHDFKENLAKSTGVDISNIDIHSIKSGSVVVDFSIALPKSTPESNVKNIVQKINDADSHQVISDNFKSQYGITGVSVVHNKNNIQEIQKLVENASSPLKEKINGSLTELVDNSKKQGKESTSQQQLIQQDQIQDQIQDQQVKESAYRQQLIQGQEQDQQVKESTQVVPNYKLLQKNPINFSSDSRDTRKINDKLDNLLELITKDEPIDPTSKAIDIVNNIMEQPISTDEKMESVNATMMSTIEDPNIKCTDGLCERITPVKNQTVSFDNLTPSQLAAQEALKTNKNDFSISMPNSPSKEPSAPQLSQVVGIPIDQNKNNKLFSQEKNPIKSMDKILPGKINFAEPRVEKIILKWALDVHEFSEFIKEKNTAWVKDAGTSISRLADDLDSRIFRIKNKSTIPLLPGEEPRIQKQMSMIYIKLLQTLNNKIEVNQQINKKFFLKENKHKLQEINTFIKRFSYTANPESASKFRENNKFQDRLNAYNNIKYKFEAALKNISVDNDIFYDAMMQLFKKMSKDKSDTSVSMKGGGIQDGLLLLEDDDRVNIRDRFETVEKNIYTTKNKIKSYYNINHNMFDVIVDSQFVVLYIIKALRILFTYIALFLATRVFSPIYEDVVYDQKKSPPPLWHYLIIFIGFDISFNVFLIVVLFLLQFLFKTDDNSFMIDKFLFYRYLGDYVLGMVVLLVIGILISKILVDKKYFKYKYEGLRAIRAFENVMFNTAIVIYLIPFFLIY